MIVSRRGILSGLAAGVAMAALPATAAGPVPPRGLRRLPGRGAPMLDVSVRGPDGAEVAFRDLRGKPTLALFWATWCVICYDEMPKLDDLHGEIGDRVNILPISIDREGMPVVKRYFERRGFEHLTPYHDARGVVFDMLGGRGVPMGFAIDSGGARRAVSVGRVDWDSRAAARYLTSL